MKRFLAILVAVTALFACSKEEDVSTPDTAEDQNSGITFNINVGDFELQTDAIKTGWTKGDKINIWFDGRVGQTPDLVMAYDGSKWTYGEVDDRIPFVDGGKFVALYEGFNDLSKYYYNSNTSNSPYFDPYLEDFASLFRCPMVVCSNGTYSYSSNTVTADLVPGWTFGTKIQVYISGLDNKKIYSLYSNKLRVLKSFGLTSSGKFLYSKTIEVSNKAMGIPYGDGLAFYYTDNLDVNGTASDYEFTLVEYSSTGTALSTKYYTAKNKTLTMDAKKCQSITIDASKFSPLDPKYVLPGVFSVSATKKVHFSKGNLYVTGENQNHTYHFESNQYDYHTWSGSYACINGEKTTNASDGRGLFFWSSSEIYASSYSYTEGYGTYPETLFTNDSSINIELENAWVGSYWAALSSDEWDYLLGTRTASTVGGTENARFAKVKVNGIEGLLLFPDSFTWVTGDDAMGAIPATCNNTDRLDWSSSRCPDYSFAQFEKIEDAGAVFLPCSGYRFEQTVTLSGGFYWASDASSSSSGCQVWFNGNGVLYESYDFDMARAPRNHGCSIRLVTTAN